MAERRPALDRLLCPLAPAAGGRQEPAGRIEMPPPGSAPVPLVAEGVGPEGGWTLFATPGPDRAPRGEPFARFRGADGVALAARFDPGSGVVTIPFSLEEAYGHYRLESWREVRPPRQISSRKLSAFYRLKPLIPRALQLAIRRRMARRRPPPGFPRWPFDGGVERLLALHAGALLRSRGAQRLRFRWFWPGGSRCAALLTHDVESAAGLRNAVAIADLEQARGLRSSFNVVGDWYPIDTGILDELTARGFEIGVHGIHHDRSLFSSRAAFRERLTTLAELRDRFGASGFRSPATHRRPEWMDELPFGYDCTIPMSDPYEAIPGGCCSPWPYFLGDLVELPYTLPQDFTLFTLLGHDSIEPWTTQFARLRQVHGLAQSVTHPDPGYLFEPRQRDLYEQFLDFLADQEDTWLPLPRELAEWWRARGRVEPPEGTSVGLARLEGEQVRFEPAPEQGDGGRLAAAGTWEAPSESAGRR